MYLITNSHDGHILHAQPGKVMAGSGETVVQVSDTDIHVNACLDNPTAYWWNGSAIVPWPGLNIAESHTTASGVTTYTWTIGFVDVQLTPPHWQYPTHVTIAAPGGASHSASFDSRHHATWEFTVHESVPGIPFSLTAAGTTPLAYTWGGHPGDVPLQFVAPSSSSVYSIAPTDTTGQQYLAAYYLKLPSAVQSAAVEIMDVLSVLDALISSTSTTPPSVWANKKSQMSAFQQAMKNIPNL